jgi:hypothetical protein
MARTGLVTYSDPHLSSFGMRDHFDYTLRWFIEGLFSDRPVEMRPSTTWTDDLWFLDQNQRHVLPNDGWWPLRTGTASGPRSSLGPAGSERTRWHPCSSGSSSCPGP